MQDFLEKGYTTFHEIDDVDYFLDRFAGRMTEVFTGIYEKSLDSLNVTPVQPGEIDSDRLLAIFTPTGRLRRPKR